MSRATLLLQLWDALQHRETTFGQVAALSAACGLDGRRVLAEHLSSIGFASGHERSLAKQRVIVEREASGPIQSPNQCFAGVGVLRRLVKLLEQRSAFGGVHPHEDLSDACPGKPRYHVEHRTITQVLLVRHIGQLMVSPLPVLTAPLHGVGLIVGGRLATLRQMKYAHGGLLSKLFQGCYKLTKRGRQS